MNNDYTPLRKMAVELLQSNILLKDLHEGEYEHVSNICNSYIDVYKGLYEILVPWMRNHRDRVEELDAWTITHDFNRACTNLKFRVNDADRNHTLLWQGIAEVRKNIRILVFILDLIVDIAKHHTYMAILAMEPNDD